MDFWSRLGEVMKQFGRVVLAAAVLFGATTSPVARAEVAFIAPTVNLALPQITFGPGINPLTGTFSNDAFNIIRAHQMALQQVQAAINYLRINRDNILAGQNAGYNKSFGDFYNPNSPYAGLYNRTLQSPTGNLDKFGNQTFDTVYNTAHYDRVLYVYSQVQAALNSSIKYSLGAQPIDHDDGPLTPAIDETFDAYRRNVATVGDPRYSSAYTIDARAAYSALNPFTGEPLINPLTERPYIDPITGKADIDPRTGRPYINPFTLRPFQDIASVGNAGVNNVQITLDDALERGLVQWGDSTSFSRRHLDQIANDPNNPLRWDDDNDLSTPDVPLTPEQELAFFKERLDAYALLPQSVTEGNSTTTSVETIFVGGAFLNEEQRSNSTPPGEPNPYFHPTDMNQYQMIIMALAQANGSTASTSELSDGTVTTTAGVSIEPGLFELFGESAYFFQSLDANSYAQFADVFNSVDEGGFGDGTLLPPPGKDATAGFQLFVPIVPGS